jgi:hypothetical protein
MQKASMISAYANSLAGKLSFDQRLSQRVREEVEDHLHEAVDADHAGGMHNAERRAMANFGDLDAIASQFAAASLAHQTRKLSVGVILFIVGIFIAMKARVAWYASLRWPLSDEMKELATIVGSIDFYAFWLAVIVGSLCLAYTIGCRVPAVFDAVCRKQIGSFVRLWAIATVALVISVVSDGVLTTIRLLETNVSSDFLIPIFSMALEITIAYILIIQFRSFGRRTNKAAAAISETV